jgi:rhomboid domain-containing protein 1
MRRGNGPDIGALMLAMQVMRIGVENIGAVTMAVLGINCALFFYDLDLPFSTADAEVCIGATQVWYGGQFRRLLLHAFFHANSGHLYANMSSLLLKGRLLESAFGTRGFAWLIFSFALSTGVVLTALSLVRRLASYALFSQLPQVLGPMFPDYHFESTCAIGFSGVLFALNTILPYVLVQPEQQQVFGFQLPTRYVTLFELVLFSMLVPNASFLGHLAGIIVGYAYCTRKLDFWFRMPEMVFAGDEYVRGGNGGGGGGGAPAGGRRWNDDDDDRDGRPRRPNNGGFFVDAQGNLRRG